MHGSPGVLGFVVGLGVGGDGNDAIAGVVAAPTLESGDEGVIPVALPGDLGAKVTAEHAEGSPGHVPGNPVG